MCDIIFLLWFRSPCLHSLLIIGWCGSNPRTVARGSLESGPFKLGLCATFYLPLISLVPSSLPSKIPSQQAPCLQTFFLRVHLSLLLLPPLRPFFFNFPSPPRSAGCHLPSAHMSDWQPVSCCPCFYFQCPDV